MMAFNNKKPAPDRREERQLNFFITTGGIGGCVRPTH